MFIFSLQIILLLLYVAQLLYIFHGMPRRSHTPQTVNRHVSVIIAVRNGERTLPTLLNCLQNQDYDGKIEILVIDDQSTDATPNIARQYKVSYERSENPQHWRSSKKAALERGAQLASGELLLFTDADCSPPPTWINGMVAQFTPDVGLVAGFSPQMVPGKTWWNAFTVTDSLAAAFAAAFGVARNAGMTCTGRNLAVRKQALADIGGYTALPNTLSGDDDFLLHAVSQHPRWQTAYATDARCHVPALGPVNFIRFVHQKTRHVSAGLHYTIPQQAGYATHHITNMGLWILGITGIFFNPLWIFPLMVKLATDFALLKQFTFRLGVPFLWRGWLLWEPLYPLYHLLAAPGSWYKKTGW